MASLGSLTTPGSAFWWPKAATSEVTPRPQVLQQIPLTYFRTYTYQPLAGNAFSMPLFGFGAAQTPLLSGRHYDPYGSVTSYAAARRYDAAAGLKPEVTAPPAPASTTPASSTTTTTTTTEKPTTTSTTTTTTTTTTPAPTTTTSSTTAAPTVSSSSMESLPAQYYEYPTYSRRVNNLYSARPQYPYPDYFNYQPSSTLTDKSGTRIQFVPCMCPVSMPSLSALPSQLPSRDRTTGVTIDTVAAVSSAEQSAELASVERNIASLQARHMESEESALAEEEDADADADASVEANESADELTKLAPEPQDTTPAVESNSLV
ncbi:CG13362 [Drosophila busckii]|uniref:CG13362 n=1 Tax=Drosophila busckii TaxID=30019 RepID=A0A0M4EI38_DROBS|nr:endochitinase A [Drosophila busckii]ALC48454.1 CG13362 [Drosophila busckii]